MGVELQSNNRQRKTISLFLLTFRWLFVKDAVNQIFPSPKDIFVGEVSIDIQTQTKKKSLTWLMK